MTNRSNHSQRGFGIIEVIVAVGLFAIFAVSGASTILHSFTTNRLADQETRAVFLAQEGIEAAKSMKNQGWSNVFLAQSCSSGCGVSSGGGAWAWSGTSNAIQEFTRVVTVTQAQRDGSNQIVMVGGTADPNTYQVRSLVTWDASPTRANQVEIVTYFTNFHKAVALQADLLEINTASAQVDTDPTHVINIYLTNNGGVDITISQMIVSWINALGGTRLNEILINGNSVWTGNSTSGNTHNITDTLISAGASNIPLTFYFSKDMSGTTIDFSAIMVDLSQKDAQAVLTGTPADTTPPAVISNLATTAPTTTSITLTWTAPGDDGNTGTATSYDIRYSTSPISEANWASASQVAGEPAPNTAGSSESIVISGLSASTTYYFAIKTSDEVPNTSAISNIASGTTTSTPITTCTQYCNSLNLGAGNCRKNPATCNQNGQTHQSGGDIYCTGGQNADTCCCSP